MIRHSLFLLLSLYGYFSSITATQKCRDKFFGRNCASRCNCQNDAHCDVITGACPNNLCRGTDWGHHCLLNSSCTYNDAIGRFYLGRQSRTRSGTACLAWSHACHPTYLSNRAFQAGDTRRENHCRNPNDDPRGVSYSNGTWCYVKCKKDVYQWCDITANCECPDYWYGVNCRYECNCYNGEVCNRTTGECKENGCARGFQGLNCSQDLSLPNVQFKHDTISTSNTTLAFSVTYGSLPECYWFEYVVKFRLVTPSAVNLDDWVNGPRFTRSRSPYANFNIPSLRPDSAYVVSLDIVCTLSNWTQLRFQTVQSDPNQPLITNCTPPELGPRITAASGYRQYPDTWPRQTGLDISWESIAQCRTASSYVLEYKSDRDNTWTVSDDLTTTTRLQLYPLIPYTNYTIRIAVKVHGDKIFGPPYQTKTLPANPGAVKNLRASWNQEERGFLVIWNQPEHIYDRAVTYRLHYALENVSNCKLSASSATEMTMENFPYTTRWLRDVKPNSDYKIKVEAVNVAGVGDAVQVFVRSGPALPTIRPPSPIAYSVEAGKNEAYVGVHSYPCDARNGDEVGYQYRLINKSDDSVVERNFSIPRGDDQKWINLDELQPFTRYTFEYRFLNAIGASPYSRPEPFTTREDVPVAPVLKSLHRNATAIVIGWEAPTPPRGVIVKYSVRMSWGDKNHRDKNAEGTERETTFSDLVAGTIYQFKICAFSRPGWGPYSPGLIVRAEEGRPGPPVNLTLAVRTSSQLSLKWDQPTLPNGKLEDYTAWCNLNFSYTAQLLGLTGEMVLTSDTAALITSLEPASRYQCHVTASTSAGSGEPISALYWTSPHKPNVNWSPYLNPSLITDSTITLDILPPRDGSVSAGPISSFRIAVEKFVPHLNKRSVELPTSTTSKLVNYDQLTDFYSARDQGLPYYVTAQLGPGFTGAFVVGDNRTYGGYFNAELERGQRYTLMFGLVASADGEEAVTYTVVSDPVTVRMHSPAPDVTAIICGVLLIAVLIPLLVAAVILYRRYVQKKEKNEQAQSLCDIRKNMNEMLGTSTPVQGPARRPYGMVLDDGAHDDGDDDDGGGYLTTDDPVYANLNMTSKNVIAVDQLLHYVQERKANDNMLFHAEFKKFPNDTKSHEAAKSPANSTKNRFKNIVAYDDSRVKLELKDPNDRYSDYINASYIDGYNRQAEYIASQGPLAATLADFWMMVWRENTRQIVMLTSCVEMGRTKCEQYWPLSRECYGGVQIETLETITYREMVTRIFRVSKGDDCREVKQFHFTAWPDHGAPKFASSILNFLRRTREDLHRSLGPIVVHCSAGVGRSGTFIALDYLTQVADHERRVDVPSTVFNLRQARPRMVQTLEQYVFLHDALLEYTLLGNTTIASCDLASKYNQLIVSSSYQKLSRLHHQYSLLSLFDRPIETTRSSAALLIENQGKNRCPDVIPDDGQRPILMTEVKGNTNYINAVFVDNYDVRDAFVVTQHPLEPTVLDFWRLVWELNVTSVVMLNAFDSRAQDCPAYLPASGTMTHGPFVIGFISQDRSVDAYAETTLKLSYSVDGHESSILTRTVKHFLVQQWPKGEAVPCLPSTMIHLVDSVELWQRKSGNKPILVHCLDGHERSGLFCATYSALERNKVDQELDVFQIVRRVRTNRPQLVGSYEQYRYIFRVVIEFIQNFGVYHNFK